MRRACWLGSSLLFLSVGCREPTAESTSPTSPKAEAENEAVETASAGLYPPTDRAWTIVDFEAMRDRLVAADKDAPQAMLRADGADAAVFGRLTDADAVSAAAKSTDDTERLLDLGQALGTIMQLYGARVARAEGFGPEYIATAAAFFHIAVIQHETLAERLGLTPTSLRANGVRLEGLQQSRYWLASTFAAALLSPLVSPDVVDADMALRRLLPVARDVTPMLLPEQRIALRAELERMSGADPNQRAAMAAALADDIPADPLVAGLLDEHRAYTRKQDEQVGAAMAAADTPIEVGPEGDAIRYAYPDRSFSAVYDTPPVALRQVSTAQDGVEITTKTLGRRDAVGFTQNITCLSRPSPLSPPKPEGGFDAAMLKAMGAASTKAIDISGKTAWEAEIARSTTRAIVRVVPVRHAGCLIVAEYPEVSATVLQPKARAFVDSVQLRFGD